MIAQDGDPSSLFSMTVGADAQGCFSIMLADGDAIRRSMVVG